MVKRLMPRNIDENDLMFERLNTQSHPLLLLLSRKRILLPGRSTFSLYEVGFDARATHSRTASKRFALYRTGSASWYMAFDVRSTAVWILAFGQGG